jgi:hypothetical protein
MSTVRGGQCDKPNHPDQIIAQRSIFVMAQPISLATTTPRGIIPFLELNPPSTP